jgi:hypothetical protein
MTIFDRESLRHRVIADASMTPLSRRTFLAGALATGILSTLPASRSAASGAWKRLVAGTRTLEVNGRAARVTAGDALTPDPQAARLFTSGECLNDESISRKYFR